MFSSQHEISEAIDASGSDNGDSSIDTDEITGSNNQDLCNYS